MYVYITTLWSCLPPSSYSHYVRLYYYTGIFLPPYPWPAMCPPPPPPSWIVLLNAHRLPHSYSLKTTQTEPWSTDGNRAMFLTLCSTPSTNSLLRDVPSNLAVPYNSFVCLSCPPVSILHPLPRPMRVGWGQKPKSLQLHIPLPTSLSIIIHYAMHYKTSMCSMYPHA